MEHPGLDRRTLLVTALGATAALVAACGTPAPAADVPASSSTPPGVPASPPPDIPREVQSEAELVALYAAVIAAHPYLQTRLAELAEQHRAHAKALGAGALPEISPPTVSDSAKAAVAKLAEAERNAARERTAACMGAPDAASARTLALIAASESSHAEYLSQGS